jgi:hypothetical protein
MMIHLDLVSPDKKKEVHISSSTEQTRVCVKSSPEHCSIVLNIKESTLRRMAEIMLHKGWRVHVT